MARSKLVGLVFEGWNDLDRVLEGVSTEEAISQLDGGSSFAWTLAHVMGMVDRWVNVRFQKLSPHPVLSEERFRAGGSGSASEWRDVQEAAREVRETARAFLETLDDADLDVMVPYDGSVAMLRETGLSLKYALCRIAAHQYFHLGEMAAKRSSRGAQVGDYPGRMAECI